MSIYDNYKLLVNNDVLGFTHSNKKLLDISSRFEYPKSNDPNNPNNKCSFNNSLK